MKNIKFRFYTDHEIVLTPAMYEVLHIDFNIGTVLIEDHLTPIEESIIHEYNLGPNGHPIQNYGFIDNAEGVLMQNTNCFDSLNKEIFEGDIVAYHYETETQDNPKFIEKDCNIGVLLESEIIKKSGYSLHVIGEINGCIGFICENDFHGTFIPLYTLCNESNICIDLTIIGNIYENKDLIPNE